MTITSAAPNATHDRARTDPISAAWMAGGTVWGAAGVIHAADGWRFVTASILWFVADAALLAGLLGLVRRRLHGRSAVGTTALGVAIVARLLFAAGEVASLAVGNDEGPLIPLGALLTAISLTTYGVVVLRTPALATPARWSLLAMGLYPFVAMFPLLAITGEPNYLVIAGWGLPAVLVGLALRAMSMSPTGGTRTS